jgi:hypothetical protein
MSTEAIITRPDLGLCDIRDDGSIIKFMAREQLDCEFNCPPYGSSERVTELLKILLGDISE